MMAVPPPLMVATTDAALAVAGYAKSTAVRTATTKKPKDDGNAARATFMCASPVPPLPAPGALGREHAGRIVTIVAYPARACNRAGYAILTERGWRPRLRRAALSLLGRLLRRARIGFVVQALPGHSRPLA